MNGYHRRCINNGCQMTAHCDTLGACELDRQQWAPAQTIRSGSAPDAAGGSGCRPTTITPNTTAKLTRLLTKLAGDQKALRDALHVHEYAASVAAVQVEAFRLRCIDLVAFYGGPVDLEAAIRNLPNACADEASTGSEG